MFNVIMRKYTAIPIYDSEKTSHVRMTDLIEMYFKSSSVAGTNLDLTSELRSFAEFIRQNYNSGAEIQNDPIDGKTVRALVLAGAAMLVDPPKRGGDYMSNNNKQQKQSIINKFKATVRIWSKKSNGNTLKAVYASILDVVGMVPKKLLVCNEVSTYKKVIQFLLGSVYASRNLVATTLTGVAGIFGQKTKTTVGDLLRVLQNPSLQIVLQMMLSRITDTNDTMHRMCNACFLYFVTHMTDFDEKKGFYYPTSGTCIR